MPGIDPSPLPQVGVRAPWGRGEQALVFLFYMDEADISIPRTPPAPPAPLVCLRPRAAGPCRSPPFRAPHAVGENGEAPKLDAACPVPLWGEACRQHTPDGDGVGVGRKLGRGSLLPKPMAGSDGVRAQSPTLSQTIRPGKKPEGPRGCSAGSGQFQPQRQASSPRSGTFHPPEQRSRGSGLGWAAAGAGPSRPGEPARPRPSLGPGGACAPMRACSVHTYKYIILEFFSHNTDYTVVTLTLD